MLGPGLKAPPTTGTASSGLAPAASREQAAAASNLIKCEGCGRSFNQGAHSVHSRVCAKVRGLLQNINSNSLVSALLLALRPLPVVGFQKAAGRLRR